MSIEDDYVIEEEYSNIRVTLKFHPHCPYTLYIFYQNQLVYFHETTQIYVDKILEITQSLSVEEKWDYYFEFSRNANAFKKKFERHDTKALYKYLAKINIASALKEIEEVLNEDCKKNQIHTSFRKKQEQEESNIYKERTDDILEKIEHTLAMLMKTFLILKKVNKMGKTEYFLDVSLSVLIERLQHMKMSGTIEIPDGEDNIDRFIKKHIKNRNGTSLDNNLRVYWCKKNKSENCQIPPAKPVA